MNPHDNRRWWVAVIGAALLWPWCHADSSGQEDATRLELDERWSNVESGKEVTIHVRARTPFVGRLTWTVSIGNASVARGEAPIAMAAGQNKPVAIKILGQSVRPGVFLEAVFTAALVKDKDAQPSAKLRRSFWVLPSDPFEDRREWAKGLKTILYDPKGTTAETLKKAEFPYEEQRNLAALEETKSGLVILGEGLSWREEAGLGDIAWKLAARGVRVLCLAPSEGTLAFPGLGFKGSKSVSQLTLRRSDIIGAWDKKLDAAIWHGNVPSVASRIGFRGDGEDIVGEAAPGDAGWPWVDVRFGDSGGAFAICGFGVIRSWDAGPTPRFVFMRALEALTEKK